MMFVLKLAFDWYGGVLVLFVEDGIVWRWDFWDLIF